MRFARGDVRDHIVSSKIDHGPPLWRRKAAQRQRSPKINFRELFGVVRFSTFATISARNGHPDCSARCPLSGAKRKHILAVSFSGFDPKRRSAAVWTSDVLIA